jgi:RHS repeat-associated protein
VDEHGDIAWHTRTTLWGTTSWNRDANAYTPLRFPGQYADPETGLHYNFFRHYDPDVARYTSPDPFGLAPAPNPMAYVHNPQTWSDPLGLVPKACKMDRYKWDGSVRFGKLDDLNRPTGVWASLRKEMLRTGSEAGTTRTPGWRGDGTAFNEARGHLLANILGGPGKGPPGTPQPCHADSESREHTSDEADRGQGLRGRKGGRNCSILGEARVRRGQPGSAQIGDIRTRKPRILIDRDATEPRLGRSDRDS